MSIFSHRPKSLSLGPLETEILEIIWQLDGATAKSIHDRILADPDRELTYASVSTVLHRLVSKGWLVRKKHQRSAFIWKPCLSRHEAQVLQAHHQVKQLLAIGNADLVAAFADELDNASLDQFEAIAQRLKAARQQRQEDAQGDRDA
jgi:predicted transcriptional regulator